jgi:hypothetical protein
MTAYKFNDDVMRFTPVFDGVRFNAITWWNFAAERWFIKITTNIDELILNAPVIESTRSEPINLLAGYFTTVMIFNSDLSTFEVG